MRLAMNSLGGSVKCNFPRLYFMVISNPVAALNNSSFSESKNIYLANGESLGSSVTSHKKAQVSSNTFIETVSENLLAIGQNLA